MSGEPDAVLTKIGEICQLKKAADLGAQAFASGIKCAPFLDKELMGMLAGRAVGETPGGEASSCDLMDAWARAWHDENLKQEWKPVGDPTPRH